MKYFRNGIYLALLLAAIFILQQLRGSHPQVIRIVEAVPVPVSPDEKPLQVLQVLSSMQSAEKPKAAQKNVTASDWAENLRQDRICEVVVQMPGVSVAGLAQALMDAPGDREPIDSTIKALYLESIAGHSSVPLLPQGLPELDFYNALAAADLISGALHKNPGASLSDANALLSDLTAHHPSNGAFPFFQAKVWSALHPEQRELAKKLLLKAFQSARFETYYLEMMRRMQAKGMASPSYLLVATTLTSSIPVPNYFSVLQLVKADLQEGDLDFDRQALRFGQKLMQPALNANLDLNQPTWSMMEYSIGRAIRNAAWQALHPGLDLPSNYSQQPVVTQSDFLADMTSDEVMLDANHCDRRGFDRLFEAERAFLSSHR